ncbi:hypothetical protein H6784_02600 [Candidatus Nomurabacteria bacterium]|nr:hypothetical protein [Candidatus Kaiserbacteria bacterium]MCB9814287.1 hypothetical protein [Candidatus Nomurabacteria bacterium]
MYGNTITSKSKPRWVKPLAIFYFVLFIPSTPFLFLGFALGGSDKNFIFLITLALLMWTSLLVGIKLGFKKENNLNFSSKSRKLMVTPIFLILANALFPMVADITSSSLRSIYKFDDTEGAIYFVLIIGSLVIYYFYYRREVSDDSQ